VNSFNPIFRATRRYDDLARKADFLKVVVYNNCGGERYAHFIGNVGSTVFRDVPKSELLQFNNHLLNYSNDAATAAALRAGADGLIFSRKYSEMRLDNLSAAGRAVREFKTPVGVTRTRPL
jgi:hypothetical protein